MYTHKLKKKRYKTHVNHSFFLIFKHKSARSSSRRQSIDRSTQKSQVCFFDTLCTYL
jgi:hypothetical protein